MIPTKPKGVVRMAAVAAVGLVAALLLAERLRTEVPIARGRPLQHDDFFFTVEDVRRAPALGVGPARRVARGTFLTITLRVENRARRVGFQFRDASARVVGDRGEVYSVSPEGRVALRSERGSPDPCAGVLPAGTSCVTELVFDVPADAKNPRLHLSGGAIGDTLDALLTGRRRLTLR